jgi:hypothetical protein
VSGGQSALSPLVFPLLLSLDYIKISNEITVVPMVNVFHFLLTGITAEILL